MADVAKVAGVSRQLVGFVFQGKSGFSPEAAARVHKAAQQLGYRPNLAAQSLRRDSTKIIGVVFDPRESSPLEIIQSLYKVAANLGYEVILSAIGDDRDEDEAIHELIGYRCEGLILIASRLAEAKLVGLATEIPFISIGRQLDVSIADSVSSDGAMGLGLVVDHLAVLGHSDIAYINATTMLDADSRLKGFVDSATRHKLNHRIIDVASDYTEESGAAAAQLLLASASLPTAVACSNDQQALGLISALRVAGISVPDQVSVVGYDDSRVARFSFMSLTTVHQDAVELAEIALNRLIERISKPTLAAQASLTSVSLVQRKSVVAKSL
jgi:DNA-binding LacI/PurR family transcriptional regulator